MKFHDQCGDRVVLVNDDYTAIRSFVEFNHGLAFSAQPLRNDILFQVTIERMVNIWNGSLEIGVTTLDPEYIDPLPATATKLRNTAWVMSGNSIVKDGVTLINSFATDYEMPQEGDRVGVMRTSKGELMFYMNGRCLGIAAYNLPPKLFAVIDIYGQCVQVSIIDFSGLPLAMIDSIEEAVARNKDNDNTSNEFEPAVQSAGANPNVTADVFVPITTEGACAIVARDPLRFYSRCGILVKLSADNKTAERARPLDDYNNGVVMTHRPLYDDELFEIRIDQLVDKWSGSVEVGVTTHDPATIRFPSTMTNMDSGTIMMSGCKVLLNGYGTCMEYGNFNLDELKEGDKVGFMRKSDGNLHYFINGVDLNIAASRVEQTVWGVIDLYGMTVKVTIIDPCEDSNSSNLLPIQETPAPSTANKARQKIEDDTILFRTVRDSNVIITSDGKTAYRPNAHKTFKNCLVMTNRTLKTNEFFHVRLDTVITKWAGSIEFGITQLTADEIRLPFKINRAPIGTWAVIGEDAIHNGSIIIQQYSRNLNKLEEGDTVGVMLKDMGVLHFYVNGIDQGPAAFNVPEHVFGIIDLYGRVAQVTILDFQIPVPIFSPDYPATMESDEIIIPDMCFHRVHGRNARLSLNRVTATRTTVFSEFNDAVLFSSMPLRECDMFELRIDRMIDCWIGSLEIGVTAIRPDDLVMSGGVDAIAGTATDLTWDTYILSGAAMMKDGECVRSGYALDLDTLVVGSRVGMMWHADRSLHYYLDGIDMGKAWHVPHLNIYAVIDLYGQCTQVTILQNEERTHNNFNECINTNNSSLGNIRALTASPQPNWNLSEYFGDNVCLLYDYTVASRIKPDPYSTLVFSSAHLAIGETFEVEIAQCKYGYAGSFRIGVTDVNILNAHINRCLPPSISYLPHYTAYIDGRYIKYSKPGTKDKEIYSFIPSFEWLKTGDKVTLKKTIDCNVLVYYNSELLDVAIEKVPDKVFVVMELFGSVSRIFSVTPNPTLPTELKLDTTPNKLTTIQSTNYDLKTQKIDDSEEINVEEISNEPSTSTDIKDLKDTLTNVCEPNTSVDTSPTNTTTVAMTETSRRKPPLPYTFHYIHGENLKLCSSDTVAVRTTSYDNGIAIISQPLKRGYSFRFRVDKITSEWCGSVGIGGVGHLIEESLPFNAVHIDSPAWIVTSDTILDNGEYSSSSKGLPLENLTEKSVLSIHFLLSSEIVINVNNDTLGAIATVPTSFNHIFPLIDLYGRVTQVSALLHPHIVASGTSIDLPIIKENQHEEYLVIELEFNEFHNPNSEVSVTGDVKYTLKAFSHNNLIDEDLDTELVHPGPSTYNDENKEPLVSQTTDAEVNLKHLTLHQSLIVSNNISTDDIGDSYSSNNYIQKSRSTHNFSVNDNEGKDTLRQSYSASSGIADDSCGAHDYFYDTNIKHNDKYPETSDVDNLDNEIMDALTLETGNLPDLTEEQSSSLDESTRRDELWSEQLSIENLNYLNRILCLDQEGIEGQSLESEWEASGENCEHLHLVLKYWNFLVCPFPELRKAVSWGQVKCYCNNCQPNSPPPLADWVRIERIDGVGAAQRGFWHVSRSTLGSAQAASADTDIVSPPRRRPRALTLAPSTSTTFLDLWFDEEGKPHQTILAIEIDIEGSDAENDRLLAFLIYLKSHTHLEDNPPSTEE